MCWRQCIQKMSTTSHVGKARDLLPHLVNSHPDLRYTRFTKMPDPHWTVWRQDDNGNRFLVSSHPTEAEARRAAAELEARGHKQLYTVEPPTK